MLEIMAIYFERKEKFKKFKQVFIKSCKKAMPKIKPKIVTIPMPDNIDHKRDTAFAFLAACNYVLKKKNTIAVCDIDLMFQKSILDIEKKDFDIAITTRDSKMKYNTGLWFYKPCKASRTFIRAWIKNTKTLMKNFCENEDFVWRHGGIDQASLYITMQDNKKIKAKIIELPCLEWNATQSEWRLIDDTTRIIHVKSKLSLVCLGKEIPEGYEYLEDIKNKWRAFLK